MLIFEEKVKNDISGKIKLIHDKIYTHVSPLVVEGYITKEPVRFSERETGRFHKFACNEEWGEVWDCAWVKITGHIPESARGKKIVMLFDCGGEAMVTDGEGTPLRGLTNVDSGYDTSLGSPGKRVYIITECAEGGEEVELWADIARNDLMAGSQKRGMKQAELAVCDDTLRDLYYDAWVLFDYICAPVEKSPRYYSILYSLREAADMLTCFSDEQISGAADILRTELSKRGGDRSLSITAIGHAHIDLAWLWPIRETKRKGARTFSTVTELMGRYPDYHFGASQPQLFKWIKDGYPRLYDKVRAAVKEGRFEIQGDMWVEADTNVPSGESLVRQFLYGKKFFKEEFGTETNMLWLPDVFGYNGNLPQIMKKSGVDYFMTQKLSWNEHNRFPHHTFIWRGIDGSGVLAHMLPEETYNSPAAPRSVRKIDMQYMDAGVCGEALMLFGIGDGGGGPGPEHLERLKRVKDFDGISTVKQGFAIDFFKRIEENINKYATYKGELYLEKHQGTYTTQAKNKYYNRKIENALRDLEFLASMSIILGSKKPYPEKELRDIWEEVLLYQFHDILPGSSIKRVYDESVLRYEAMLAQVKELTAEFTGELRDFLYAPEPESLIAINTTSFPRVEWLTRNGITKKVLLSPMSYSAVSFDESSDTGMLTVGDDRLENDCVAVLFNNDGTICSVFDKVENREVLKKGSAANKLAVYDDTRGDCWDINITYREREPEAFALISSVSFVKDAKAVMEQEYEYGSSRIKQTISLEPGSKLIRFDTVVDWHENLKMLRTSFDVDIFTDTVTCDIQFGKISRSALNNNRLDMAQFEICAHKWIDYSRRDYGVALINDCKYGHYAKNGTLDLNLLRSQNSPGKDSDRGVHEITYALYPHMGDEAEGQVNKAAYLLNNPIITVEAGTGSNKFNDIPFISAGSENVCVETLKKAEDCNGCFAVRAYEFDGVGANTYITLPHNASSAFLSDLMEQNKTPLEIRDGKVYLKFAPFEIKTLVFSL